jgi:exodeoxyribonuclease V alpha subunit
MIARKRTEAAARDATVVVHADGLLAAFNDAGVLDPLDVLSAQTITRLCGETDERVALAAAMAVRGTRFGHVCIRLGSLREAVVVDGQDLELVEALPWPDPDEWMAALVASPMIGDGGGNTPMVIGDGRLYLERYFRYEQHVANLLLDRCGRAPKAMSATLGEMLDVLLPTGSGAGSRQHEAAVLAATGNLAVVAGGPGTGKTHTIGALLTALAVAGELPLVAVCAPTGKAAARLGEAIAKWASEMADTDAAERLATIGPSTIHRLLGWTWERGQFRHDAQRRLPHDLVVVDEMSMVSLPLAAKLLQAVRDDASVVLVGDPFQLESIEAGTVLADVVGPAVTSGAAIPEAPIGSHVVVLDRTHRFEEGSVIADLADAVRLGDGDRTVALLAAGSPDVQWVPQRSHPGFRNLWTEVVASRLRLVELAARSNISGSLEALGEMAVLCARREGPEGVAQWRRTIEAALDERFTGLRYGGEWYPGRPVMVTKNDYDLELYNGDIGITVATDEGLRLAFDRSGIRELPLSHLGEHVTSHAMTIHKSQGSQFRSVVVVLPGEASRLLTRELLYTAVTRASEEVWVVGDEAVVRAAVERSVQRASGLGDRLWGESGTG